MCKLLFTAFNFELIYIYIYIYRKVRLMKPTHDSPLLRVSCLRTHQTVFNKENSYHLVYIQVCEESYCYLHNYNGRE